MARRDMGPRTMTNFEMQDRTTTDVIGKADALVGRAIRTEPPR
jgi:hypothetical protein